MPHHRTALASYRPGGPLGAGFSLAGRNAPTPATGDPGGFSWDGAPPSGDGSLGPAADHPLRVVVPSPKKSSRVW